MKKSELRNIIREEIERLSENELEQEQRDLIKKYKSQIDLTLKNAKKYGYKQVKLPKPKPRQYIAILALKHPKYDLLDFEIRANKNTYHATTYDANIDFDKYFDPRKIANELDVDIKTGEPIY